MRQLKPFLRSSAFTLLRFSGLPVLIREFIQRKKVTIIVYHALDAKRAIKHFSALQRRYNIIPLSQFLAVISGKESSKLPPKSLIITFDDGHKSNYGLISVLRRKRIPLTIFLCSGIIGTKRHYWWSHVKDDEAAKKLKVLPNDQRVETLLSEGYTEEKEYEVRQALSYDEIEEMKSIVDFQSHTVFHPILPTCSDERARKEIIESKEDLKREFGFEIYALAYPNGDYSDRDVNLLKKAGYTCGLTLDAAFNDSETDPFRLRRLAMFDDAGVSEVIVKASGLWAYLTRSGSKRSISSSQCTGE